MRACDVAELTDEVIDITVDHSMRISSPLTGFPIWQMGGAVARVDEDETAFDGRGAGHTFNIAATTECSRRLRRGAGVGAGLWSALEPYHTGVYVNFLMEEGEERVRQAYGAREVRAAEGFEAPLRPGQPLQAQPEHPARVARRRVKDRGNGPVATNVRTPLASRTAFSK